MFDEGALEAGRAADARAPETSGPVAASGRVAASAPETGRAADTGGQDPTRRPDPSADQAVPAASRAAATSRPSGTEESLAPVEGSPVSVARAASRPVSAAASIDDLPDDLAAELRVISAAIDRLQALDLHQAEGAATAALFIATRRVADRLRATADRMLPVVEADGLWALDGSQSAAAWAARRTGARLATMKRDIRLARALRDDLPMTSAAVLDGSITLEHAHAMARSTVNTEARREALSAEDGCNEEFLVENARGLDADRFSRIVRHWAAAADPEADDRGYRDAADREFVELSPTLGGYHLAGFLTDEHGRVVATALESVMGVPSADEVRTTAQRRAAALHDLARLCLDHGRTGAGAAVRPHLSVVVSLQDLERLGARQRPTLSPPVAPAEPAAPTEPHALAEPNPQGSAPPPSRESDEPAPQSSTASASVPQVSTPPHRPGSTAPPPRSPAPPPARDWALPPTPGSAPPHPADSAPPHPTPGALPPALPSSPTAEDSAPAHQPRPVATSSGDPVATPGPSYDDGAPVPPAVLARLACDSEVTRIVFGAPGVVLDVGRKERTVTKELRRAVIARDRTCMYPGCGVPPARSEVHHPHHWAAGGVTSVTNSILLCWHHHEWVHRHAITMRLTDGAWSFVDRNGRALGSSPVGGTTVRNPARADREPHDGPTARPSAA